MLSRALNTPPLRLLMTLDAVGGVWRYAVDLARQLGENGVECLLVGFGPAPDEKRCREVDALPRASLIWPGEPLDWMVDDERELEGGTALLIRLVREWEPDLLHLNLPSQARGLPDGIPVLVASHSCVATWWQAVRGGPLPAEWDWQVRRNREGMYRAQTVLAPSRSHGRSLEKAYGPVGTIAVVPNAGAAASGPFTHDGTILAVGRWWDDGKNVAVLDEAAGLIRRPLLMAGPLTGPNGQTCTIRSARALGELESRDVLQLLESAAILVAPSRYEPFGLAVLEAAQRGTALVLSDIPTFRELWDGAALFVPARSSSGFAEAIETLSDDDGLRERLASVARERARRFTPENQMASMLALYGRTLAFHQQGARPLPFFQAAE